MRLRVLENGHDTNIIIRLNLYAQLSELRFHLLRLNLLRRPRKPRFLHLSLLPRLQYLQLAPLAYSTKHTHTHTIRTTTWDLNNLCPYAQNTKPPTALGQKQRRNTLSNHAALLIRHFLKKFPRMPLLMLALMTLQCIRDIAEF